jgi:hypothetical protein
MAQAGRFETTDETKEELKMRDQILSGHAAQVMRRLASGSIDCIITSPPYWNAVSDTWPTYETFLDDMQSVWIQAARVRFLSPSKAVGGSSSEDLSGHVKSNRGRHLPTKAPS